MSEISQNEQEKLPCRSEAFGRFCEALPQEIPCCEAIECRSRLPREGVSFPDEIGLSSVFEARDILLEAGFFKFRNTSDCMFPVLKRGDHLRVKAACLEEMNVGDIAIFKDSFRFYSHRVVDRQLIDPVPCLITQPDTSPPGRYDPPVTQEMLVGKVLQVERRGRALSPRRRRSNSGERFSYFVSSGFEDLAKRGKRRLAKGLDCAQSLPAYRTIGRFLTRQLRSKAVFYLALPTLSGIEARFYKNIPIDEASVDLLNLKSPVLYLVMAVENQKVGFLGFIKRPQACPHLGWWIHKLYIRMKYRGLGFGTLLMKKAEQVITRVGISRLRVSHPSPSPPVEAFLSRLGFKIEFQDKDRVIREKVFSS